MTSQAATIEKIIARVKEYNPSVDSERIMNAYNLCVQAHGDQLRNSGEPYYIHPLEVSYILADMELDPDTVIVGLLHDVIEDTPYGYEKLKGEFGEQVAYLVEGVTKLDKIKSTSREEAQMENLRKMILAMAKDIRVILVKLADRLHNMRTMKYMSEEKQREKSHETLEVYAPLAHRLGISRIKSELEDLSIKYLDSVGYYEIVEGLKQKKGEREEYVTLIKESLGHRLSDMNINSHISGRAKHIYSIYRKMYSQDKTLDEIYDLFAVRIIVDSVAECYSALGMVHELYKPIPGRFKDYIAMPKPNMYQSLHTTLIGPTGQPFEVQIRTWEMHKVAEQGVAAHWKYKEGITGETAQDEKLAWVRQLLEVQSEATDSEDFMKSLKIDLFADEVFVFTPKGDVVSLPLGATPIDFAFYIHTAVGYKMTGAKANARIVPLDYHLKNGDIVEIITTSQVKGPSRDWLNIVKTAQARSKINAWFKKENREINVEKGREAVEREIRKLNLNPHDLLKNEYIEPMIRRYGFNTLEDAYSAVGYGGITAVKIAVRLREYAINDLDIPVEDKIPVVEQQKKSGKPSNGIEVEGVDNCLVRLSKCCNPVPGDDIIGFITRGRGVSVHRTSCVNVREDKLDEESRARRIRCTWADGLSLKYSGELYIECADRKGIFADIASVVAENQINIVSVVSHPPKAKVAMITLQVEVASRDQLNNLMKKLYRVPGILDIRS
ncbi:MAG: bifunctional (p)ppGpp synthetase/guanosine-3',5'-bis(diphosphate) 3'-pyrophosphohydrolase [Clostridia bacterium]|nr:bifunctional (p)ppGpp synthetase/guanosine-3',5'-bis(diphosphate) 3'-pyrophosphohydrolase [Clostridia bacterium]